MWEAGTPRAGRRPGSGAQATRERPVSRGSRCQAARSVGTFVLLREVPMMKSAAFVCGSVVLALAASGCSGHTAGTTTSGSSGSTGAGGAGGAPSIPYPTCPTTRSAVFTGTLDGMPFDKTVAVNGTKVDHINAPETATVYFEPDGELDLFWAGTLDNFTRFPTTGTLLFPGETTKHSVKAGSTIVFSSKGQGNLLMDLVLEDGELFVCSFW